MRVALVSPYSWTYPGGVTRHIEALAGQLLDRGHHVRVLAPFDPPDRRSARMHRGAAPQERAVPDWLVPIGRTIGLPSNGAVSNVSLGSVGYTALRRELATGGYDVVHVHEPVTPLLGWDTLMSTRLPLVGTFHCYSERVLPHAAGNLMGAWRRLNRLRVRIAVSEAAAWTGRRFYGGRYRIIPNGVHVEPLPAAPPRAPGAPLKIVFVGQAVERKGLPVLLRAFEALRDHGVPVSLELVGVGPEQIEGVVGDAAGITALGKVSEARKLEALRAADVACAPSLGGESFGMVLTEAFAAGTPVVASDIAGYRDVVRDRVDGLLVPPGDALALAETLHDLALDPTREAALSAEALHRAERFAWPRVADEVLTAYEDAAAMPEPEGLAVQWGFRPADGLPVRRARRLPSLEPGSGGLGRIALRVGKRVGVAAATAGGVALSVLAVERIGIDAIGNALLRSSPAWVVFALAIMCLSMVFRAVAWRAILAAALPGHRVRFIDSLRGTSIGVLMSATLPARLGEPSRAIVVARRIGRAREVLPAVLGSIVSQALVNILALVVLGVTMFSTIDLFHGHEGALVALAVAPAALLAAVLAAPALLASGVPSRSRRVAQAVAKLRTALARVRDGLLVFRSPRLGAEALVMQLGAWALQATSCWLLLVALGLDDKAGFAAAAAVLFAVNVTAAIPATPSNLGVFQAACVAVLAGGYGINSADALGYGIILQAVEIATAVVMGAPALVNEGLSWKDVRLRALHHAPIRLRTPAERAAGSATQITG